MIIVSVVLYSFIPIWTALPSFKVTRMQKPKFVVPIILQCPLSVRMTFSMQSRHIYLMTLSCCILQGYHSSGTPLGCFVQRMTAIVVCGFGSVWMGFFQSRSACSHHQTTSSFIRVVVVGSPVGCLTSQQHANVSQWLFYTSFTVEVTRHENTKTWSFNGDR